MKIPFKMRMKTLKEEDKGINIVKNIEKTF